VDSAQRQASFQDVFLGDEPPLPSGIDVLSVTTTMEAGVDIGALRAVLMANVPPMRFNYQQRVGRAGRRGEALSVALTVAQARSHDQDYFLAPQRITRGAPPPPFLATDRVEIIQRFVRAFALDQAFRAIRNPDDAPLRAVHGDFGQADEWASSRESVRNALAERADVIGEFAVAALEKTRASLEPSQLLEDVLAHLVEDIDKVARRAGEEPELSQRLAEFGLLPMFGFPTQVRYLFYRRPRNTHGWPPRGTVARELPLAVSEFAPGNEIVVDKKVYRSTGFVDFKPGFAGVQVGDDPFGQMTDVGLCDLCKNIDEEPSDQCGTCQASAADGHYRVVPLSKPRGFRATWESRPQPFEGGTDRLSRASTPRVAVNASAMLVSEVEGFRIRGGPTRLYTVNDNHGALFTLTSQDSAFFGWTVPGRFSDEQNEAKSVAIGARVATDVLLIEPVSERVNGWTNLLSGQVSTSRLLDTARRAAWTSVAFAFRAAASVLLQVEVREIDAGVRLVAAPDGRGLLPQVFMADTIENGAGYVRHLGSRSVFDELAERFGATILQWEDSGHDCDSACYRCLKDWTNTPYHPVLDWRLAADAFEIARFGAPRHDRWEALRMRAVRGACASFERWRCDDPTAKVPLIRTHRKKRPVVVAHPLAESDGPHGRPSDPPDPDTSPVQADVFTINRRPGAIYLEVR